MFNYVTLLLCLSVIVLTQNAPQVKIEQGTLKGRYRKTWHGKVFSSFTGIPYAEPPVGDLRFKASVPAKPWKGVLDTTQKHSICPQMNIYVGDLNVTGDEDCLYLNVYTPKIEPSKSKQELLPVMFYIHGGGWTCGSANLYGPKILLDKNVVLVTVNYRLGALGFLTTGDHVVPGNNGLKDQALALKWVKNNIIEFRGDPNRITIFGQSAGGSSVHYHTLSPLTKNLISGAIIQSGSALAPWALGLPKLALNNTKNLANFVNCPYQPSEDLVNCLKKLSAHEIVAQDTKFLEWSYHPMIPFKPVIEKESEGAFLTEDPIDIIKSNKAAKVPIIIGLTTEDGAFKAAYVFKHPKLMKEVNSDFNRMAPFLLIYHESLSDQDKISEKVKNYYFGDGKIDDNAKSKFTDMITDSWIYLPIDETVSAHTKYTNQKVYFYLFGYRGSETFTNLFKSSDDHFDYGTCHGDELLYLFNSEAFPNYKPNEKDLCMNNLMTSLWTNFARTGNPSTNEDDSLKAEWHSVKSKNHEFYFIKSNEETKMQNNLYPDRIKFWKDVSFNDRWLRIKDEL